MEVFCIAVLACFMVSIKCWILWYIRLTAKCVCYAVVATVLGKYVNLLNDVSTANYERAVTCDVAKHFFSLVEFANNETLTSLHAAVLSAVKSFTSSAADEEETVLTFVALLLFILALLIWYDFCSVANSVCVVCWILFNCTNLTVDDLKSGLSFFASYQLWHIKVYEWVVKLELSG